MVLTQAGVVTFAGYGLGTGCTALFFRLAGDSPAMQGFVLHWQVMAIVGALIAFIAAFSIIFSLRKVFKIDPAVVFKG
jgi:putative ABC transport system permease protein